MAQKGSEKGRDVNAQLTNNSPYVIQPHLEKKKPSALLMFIAILLTLCVIALNFLGTVWLMQTHIWLTDIQKPKTMTPLPTGIYIYITIY